MKVCAHCGAVYRDHVDFCFGDGEVLAAAPGGAPLQDASPDSLDPRVDASTLELIKLVEEAVVASVTAARKANEPAPKPPSVKKRPPRRYWMLPLVLGCLGVAMGVLGPLLGGSLFMWWVGQVPQVVGLP